MWQNTQYHQHSATAAETSAYEVVNILNTYSKGSLTKRDREELNTTTTTTTTVGHLLRIHFIIQLNEHHCSLYAVFMYTYCVRLMIFRCDNISLISFIIHVPLVKRRLSFR